MIELQIKGLSVNSAYKGKRFRTDSYNAFIKNMMLILPKTVLIPNKDYIVLTIEFGFSSKLSDIDNCVKSLADCLVKKYGVDDRYIYELKVKKFIVSKGKEFIRFKIE